MDGLHLLDRARQFAGVRTEYSMVMHPAVAVGQPMLAVTGGVLWMFLSPIWACNASGNWPLR